MRWVAVTDVCSTASAEAGYKPVTELATSRRQIEEIDMDPQYVLGVQPGRDLLERRFASPEWQHRVALAAAREPWRRKFGRGRKPWRPFGGKRRAGARRWLTPAFRQECC